jgi:hypothetical protein
LADKAIQNSLYLAGRGPIQVGLFLAYTLFAVAAKKIFPLPPASDEKVNFHQFIV